MWTIIIAIILTLIVTSIWNPEKKSKSKNIEGDLQINNQQKYLQDKYKQIIEFLDPDLDYKVLKNNPRELVIHFCHGNTEFKLYFVENLNLVTINMHSIARGNGFEIFNIKLEWEFDVEEYQSIMIQRMQFDMEKEMEAIMQKYNEVL